MELNRNKTGHLRMDDLNLREELVKIIRTHIAKTGERHKNASSQCVAERHRKSDTNIKHKHTNAREGSRKTSEFVPLLGRHAQTESRDITGLFSIWAALN